MPTLFELNGSVKQHFFHFEYGFKNLFTVISTENFKTLSTFCDLLIPPRTTCVGHSTVRPGIRKMLRNVASDI
jgi:hypothetical protein